jgi:hypothetical protein
MMRTIRRLYLYSVAFLSLEVMLWGAIGFLRAYLSGGRPVGGDVRLAESLSLLVVGLPVFLLHGWLLQRSAARDSTERSARVRAVFLYAALLTTLLPALSNLLALINRGLLSFFGASPSQAVVGGDQTGLDNLVAIFVNLLGAALVFLLLKADWGKPLLGNAYFVTRRLFRLLWLVTGVVLIVSGLALILQFIIGQTGNTEQVSRSFLPGGLSLLLMGIPLWFFVSRRIEASLSDPAEQHSVLRLFVLYFLAIAGLSALLLTAGLILEKLLRTLLGAGLDLPDLLEQIRLPFSIALPMGAVWGYYRHQLQAERQEELSPARHGQFLRLYRTIFAFFGLVAAWIGLYILLEIGLASGFAGALPRVSSSGANLAPAIACLLVGFPVWLFFWRTLQAEAGDPGEAGDRSRRSLVRKFYLYGILFIALSGLMASTGQLVFLLLQSTLGDPIENLLQDALPGLKNFLLFAPVLAYHGWVLRQDARQSERSLAKRRALYPVLVLVPDEGDFAVRMVSALEHYIPGLPVAVHPISSGAPDESLSAAKAVILPFEILAKPPEALRLWLQSFSGERLVVPSHVENWYWVAGSRLSTRDPAQNAALVILDRVEGNRASGE